MFLLCFGLVQTVIVFTKFRPNKVIGMGGYASGIGGLIAKFSFTPLIIHEQNTVPGTTNKLLSKLSTKCFQAFENTFHENVKAITIGNPILFNPIPKVEPKSIKNILVLGGSLGAKKINQRILMTLKKESTLLYFLYLPYILWLSFAAFLNASIVFLN